MFGAVITFWLGIYLLSSHFNRVCSRQRGAASFIGKQQKQEALNTNQKCSDEITICLLEEVLLTGEMRRKNNVKYLPETAPVGNNTLVELQQIQDNCIPNMTTIPRKTLLPFCGICTESVSEHIHHADRSGSVWVLPNLNGFKKKGTQQSSGPKPKTTLIRQTFHAVPCQDTVWQQCRAEGDHENTLTPLYRPSHINNTNKRFLHSWVYMWSHIITIIIR